MKKKPTIIIAAIALIAVLCGCKPIPKTKVKIKQNAEEVNTIEYQGHSYVCYRFYGNMGYSGWGGASIVHDPDCKCGKGK